jgi:predicted  nucleic acid-binding Zn-ribbon protein
VTDLDALVTLQDGDTAADQLRHRRAHLPERAAHAEIAGEAAAADDEAAALGSRRDELVATQDRLEADVTVCETTRAGLARQLATTSVPREAQALSSEIETLDARQRSLEDELLDAMEALEPIDARLAVLAAARPGLHQRAAAAATELAAAEDAVDAELAALDDARAELVATVPGPLLGRYERLRSRLGGVAVAHVDHGRCSGCNLVRPTLELERLRAAAADAVVECEQCGRILVR